MCGNVWFIISIAYVDSYKSWTVFIKHMRLKTKHNLHMQFQTILGYQPGSIFCKIEAKVLIK